MSIEKLRAFCGFVEANASYEEASHHSHKSSSAIYKNIKSLEEELGVLLVESIEKKPVLSKRGEIYYRHAKKIVDLYDKAANNIRQPCAFSGTIKILTTQSIAALWICDDLAEFAKNHSEWKISIIGSDKQPDILEDYDVIVKPMIPDPLQIYTQRILTTQKMSLYASEEYIQAHGMPHSPNDLQNHRLIGYGEDIAIPYDEINWHLHINDYRFESFYDINSGLGMLKAIENGIGIGPASNIGESISRVKLVKVLPEYLGPTVKWYFITKGENAEHPAIKLLYEYLSNHFSKGSDYSRIKQSS